jgi:hypothetical protein
MSKHWEVMTFRVGVQNCGNWPGKFLPVCEDMEASQRDAELPLRLRGFSVRVLVLLAFTLYQYTTRAVLLRFFSLLIPWAHRHSTAPHRTPKMSETSVQPQLQVARRHYKWYPFLSQ